MNELLSTCRRVLAEAEESHGVVPFRMHIAQLTRKETYGEAIELLMRFLRVHDAPTHLSQCLVFHFLDQCGEALLVPAYKLTKDNRHNTVDTKYFAKAVIEDFVVYLRKGLEDEEVVELKKVYSTDQARMSAVIPTSQCCMKNTRRTQEDRHLTSLASHHALYCVFDGHGGDAVANYACTHIALHFDDALRHQEGEKGDDQDWKVDLTKAMRRTFSTLDDDIVYKCEREKVRGGCTSVVCNITRDGELTVGWCGDSHALLVDRSAARALTSAHNLSVKEEYRRVVAAGGQVLVVNGEPRVNGVLNLTRSFGDILCRPCITGEPAIVQLKLDAADNLLIICCDGVFDVFDSEVFYQCCEAYMGDHASSEFDGLAACLCDLAKELGSTDNLTCVVVALRPLDEFWPKGDEAQ